LRKGLRVLPSFRIVRMVVVHESIFVQYKDSTKNALYHRSINDYRRKSEKISEIRKYVKQKVYESEVRFQ